MAKRKRICITCGAETARATSCTNRRCLDCHHKHCTPGGSTSPGHGLGDVENPYEEGPPELMELLRL